MTSLTAVIAAVLLTTSNTAAPISPWTVAPSPNPSLSANRPRGLAAPAADAVWSVGTWRDDATGRQRTLTQRWDGSAWRTVASPGTPGGNDNLTAVAGASPSQLWAVGFSAQSAYDPDSPADPDRGVPLILRGDGASWSVEPVEMLGAYGHLTAVDLTGPADGWAVGSSAAGVGATPRGLILRWNGSVWLPVAVPDTGTQPVHLTGVSATSTKDAWAVGYSGVLGSTAQAIVWHWNGQDWRQVDLGVDPGAQTVLFSVSAASDGSVWAVGYRRAADRQVGYALRWSGGVWQTIPVAATDEGTQLRSVVAVPAGVWAVGYNVSRGVDNALILSFNGAGLVKEILPAPPIGRGNVAGTAVTAIAATTGAGELWAAGCLGHQTRMLRRDTGDR
ncbi:hypothetical protein [Actinoplanes aureus]|uniref:Uncharacterized protein n=1 Tax=Actinoplanes aureus TaxID=2792083 RepID=A0A931CLS9_9ACTN|nr:hypothetical protein [Actinoplanes aureus]MBG0568623.1 hypothetical protein [Actinoplanes aureus]